MAIKPLQITTGDTRPWKFTLKDETGTAVDLTSAIVNVYGRKRGVTTNWIAGTAVLTSTTGGVITYNATTTDVMLPGTFDLELKITDSGGKVQRNFELIPLEVREAFT